MRVVFRIRSRSHPVATCADCAPPSRAVAREGRSSTLTAVGHDGGGVDVASDVDSPQWCPSERRDTSEVAPARASSLAPSAARFELTTPQLFSITAVSSTSDRCTLGLLDRILAVR